MILPFKLVKLSCHDLHVSLMVNALAHLRNPELARAVCTYNPLLSSHLLLVGRHHPIRLNLSEVVGSRFVVAARSTLIVELFVSINRLVINVTDKVILFR